MIPWCYFVSNRRFIDFDATLFEGYLLIIFQNTAGGTNFLKLVVQIYFRIYTVIDREKDRKRDATRAIFILTDAEASFGMYDHRNLNYITNLLKSKYLIIL